MLKSLQFLLFLFIAKSLSAQPSISFTFDDGNLSDQAHYSLREWNDMILSALKKADVKAVFFVRTQGMNSKKGNYILNTWNESGHKIANHTFSHPNFNSKKISASDFEEQLLKADSLIKSYDNYYKLFRFPYLKEGNTQTKVDSIRKILRDNGYRNGYVTIDASDWYVNSRLKKRLKQNPNEDITGFKEFYLEHIFERASYYENLSYQLNGRHIKHTLLLHHNLTSALFLSDLIKLFQSKGWDVISADEAFKDPIFKKVPKHAGESLIWALAKDSGKFKATLRYPAEDSRYEKEKMDRLGL